MKKLFSLLTVLAMLLTVAPIVGVAEADAPEEFALYSQTGANNGPFAEMYMFRKIEKLFGIKLNIVEISSSVWSEKIPIAFATGEYPDFFMGGLSDADIQTYGAQGILIDLKDYITEENTPNLYELYKNHPIVQKNAMSYDGRQYVIKGYQGSWSRDYVRGGFFVNTQWISNLGLEEPSTLNEFYEILKAFKDGDPNGNGDTSDEIPMGGAYATDPYSLLTLPLAAYGYVLPFGSNNLYVDVSDDGKVLFVPVAENFKDVLAWMNKLYAEELLDREYFTQSGDQVNAKQAEGIVGCFMDWAPFLDMPAAEMYEQYDGITPLTSDANDTRVWPGWDVQSIGQFMITDKCKNVEKLLQIADWAVTVDGHNTMLGGEEVGKMEGMEDAGYTINYYDDSYGENAFGLSYTYPAEYANDTEWRQSVISPGWGSLPVSRANFVYVETAPQEIALTNALVDNYLPYLQVGWPSSVKFTEAEMETLSLLSVDIDSYIDQMVAKFITGEESLDNFDAFIDGCNSRGLEQYLQIYQTAYDRYIAQ